MSQTSSQEDRHGVVAGGLDLERRGHPLLQLGPRVAQEGEHGRGVGGPYDRADQHALQPVQAQRPGRKHPHQRRGDHHAGRRQEGRRPQCNAEPLPLGAHAPIENDDRQGERADDVGRVEIVEADSAGAVFAGKHAQAEKNQQQRRAHAGRELARHDADDEEERADEDCGIPELQRLLPTWSDKHTASAAPRQ
jgi:hypothetical protein